MKQEDRKKKSLGQTALQLIDGLVNNLLLFLAALVFLFGFYALWDANQVYSLASSSEYETYKPVAKPGKDELASFTGFEKLQKINPEVLGWINVYGTNIDYPLVQAKDNEKYLNRDSKGEFAATGAIFLEARNSPNFDDFNTIIYGHHVENGVMFGDVAKFAKQDFFDQHRYGSIFYNGKEHGLEIVEMLEVDAYDFNIYNPGVQGDDNRQAYLDNLLKVARHKRDIPLGPHDQIVLLSTCFLDVTNGRHIVVAKITDEVPKNTFHNKKSKPFPYSVFDDSSFGHYLSAIPLWVWYIILVALFLLLIFLIVVIILILYHRNDEEQDGK
ncbi:NPQTN specific sortase B [Streptococcus sp. DD10]|nr:class B sortase [Streptococcus sp. DD10]KXT75618.1 NPQTN specific sortase B [Streptococcus sp. DD10]